MDTNTPKNKSADTNYVEALWKKRFHIGEPPKAQLNYYLRHASDWEESPTGPNKIDFYRYAPEFTIHEEADSTRDGYEVYLFGQIDIHPHWFNIYIKYYLTTIEYFSAIGLDGGRCFVVCPEKDLLSCHEHEFDQCDVPCFYYVKGSLRYNLFLFNRQQASDEEEFSRSLNQFMKLILIFDSNTERLAFFQFFQDNQSEYIEFSKSCESTLTHFPTPKGYDMEEMKNNYIHAVALKNFYEKNKQSAT